MEMVCLMHEAEPRGSLLVNGRPVGSQQLAALAGTSSRETATMLAELEAAGVFSRDENGTIYSRRMRREAEKAERDRRNGKLGGNPMLKGGVNPPENPRDKAYVDSGVSSESFVSISESIQKETSPREPGSEPSWRIEFDMIFWPEYPHQVGKPRALSAFIGARRKSTLDEIISGLERYKREKPPDRQWLNPATFLGEERFNDKPAANPRQQLQGHDALLEALARQASEGSRGDQRTPDADGRQDSHRQGEGGDSGGNRSATITALPVARRP